MNDWKRRLLPFGTLAGVHSVSSGLFQFTYLAFQLVKFRYYADLVSEKVLRYRSGGKYPWKDDTLTQAHEGAKKSGCLLTLLLFLLLLLDTDQ
jgi:hypothetical protein